jgi:hypothetical protein
MARSREEPSNFKLDIVTQKEDKKAPDTSSETKKMTGFADINAVAAAAPDKASSSTAATPASRAASPRVRQKAEADKKQEEKDKRVEEALSKVGTAMMRELAQLPYEAWAFFFSDPGLKLDAKQSEELANSYYLIFQALKPEQLTDWKVLLALALLQNFRIVIVKLREHSVRVEDAKKRAAAMGNQVSLENAPDVTIV